ncbi:DUF4230 domain-containing protein [Roseivirga sp. BDSF3-8]|uniref:DUF4230 domain-containing protein n=1 Tax=Roseivirga sp. BDSF3-8 TaxID=3241598 RepID=UPI003531C488
MKLIRLIIKLFLIAGILFLLYLGWEYVKVTLGNNRSEDPTTVETGTILRRMETMGKLELVKFTMQEVVEVKKRNDSYLGIFPVPDSKILVVTSGEAAGCVDLTRIIASDIYQEGDTMIIQLPEPELCYFKVNLQNSKVYSLDKALWMENPSGNLVQRAYREAERQVKISAIKGGILEQTKTGAEQVLVPLLEQMTGKHVILRFPEQVAPTYLEPPVRN